MKKVSSNLVTYIIPIVIGILIILGVLLTYYQLSSYQDQITKTNKEQYVQAISNMIDRRQSRIQTITSSIIAFYEGSQNVEEHEFQIFSKRLLENNPEITNIFVLEDKNIIQSYPHKEFLSQNFDAYFSGFPIVIDGNEVLTAEFLISDDLFVIIAFPYNYFISDDDLFFDNYKIILTSQIQGLKLYEVEKKHGIKSYDNIEFSSEELKESIHITKPTKITGYKLGENYVLDYIIWDDTFSSKFDFNEISILGIGISMSIVIPLLLYNSLKLARSLRIKSNDLQKSYEKIKQVDKQKDEFTTMITHELKTPLVPILGYSDLLVDGTLGDLSEKQREKIKIIKENGEKLTKLINDILDVHKLELDQLKINPVTSSINQIISGAMNNYMTVTKENNIKLEFSPKEDFKVRCDSDRIIQVVNNLIGNAIKFVSKKEGLIQIKTKSEDNMCIVSVSDNGIGIAKDLQPNLFQKFYQVDTSLTRKSGGTGLGLAICKGIVTSHNGKIWLKSNKGEGCTFYFSLPMEPDQI